MNEFEKWFNSTFQKHQWTEAEIDNLREAFKAGLLFAAQELRDIYTSGGIDHQPAIYYAKKIESKAKEL